MYVGDTGLKRCSDKEVLIISKKIIKIAFYVCYFLNVVKGNRFKSFRIGMRYHHRRYHYHDRYFKNRVCIYLIFLPLHETSKCVKMHFKYFIFPSVPGISFLNTSPLRPQPLLACRSKPGKIHKKQQLIKPVFIITYTILEGDQMNIC